MASSGGGTKIELISVARPEQSTCPKANTLLKSASSGAFSFFRGFLPSIGQIARLLWSDHEAIREGSPKCRGVGLKPCRPVCTIVSRHTDFRSLAVSGWARANFWRSFCIAKFNLMRALTDAPVQTLPAPHANPDFLDTQPTGVPGCVEKLWPLKKAAGAGCGECFIKRPG